VTTAKKRVDSARKTERGARDEVAQATQSVAGLEQRMSVLSEQVAGHDDRAAVELQLAALDTAAKAAEAARRAEAAARAEEREAREAVTAVDERLQRAASAFRGQRDALVQRGAEPPPESGDLAADWRGLAEWAASVAPDSVDAAATADTRAEELRGERDVRLAGLVERAREHEIELPLRPEVDELADAVVQAEHEAKAELERVRRGIDERAKLERELASAGSEVQVARELARLLDANHFERWLAVEALELLVAGASERLRELTGGQYSMAAEEGSRDLLVVDHGNADERRSVRTLSGGETFQASLALALALADQLGDFAAEGAARLESIFLDEGFGSLDPDTLETVAGTIESLGSGDRMVGVVTHVRDLADRMPVQYRVTKGPRTATIEPVTR
jgi:exonuclease SbcC